MDNKISFTGFKNVGAATIELAGNELTRVRHLVVELDDVGTPDLQNFKKALKKYPFRDNKNFLELDIYEDVEPNIMNNVKTQPLINQKPIMWNVETLAIFKMITDLTNRIGKSKKQGLQVSDTYLKSPECRKNFTDFINNEYLQVDLQEGLPLGELHDPIEAKTHGIIFREIFDNLTIKLKEMCN